MPHHKFPGGGGGGRETLFLPFLPFSHKSCEKILRQIEMHLEKDTFMSNNEGNSVRGCYSSFSNTEYDVQSSFINHPNRRRRHSLLTKTGGKFKGKVDSFPAKKRSSRKKDFFSSLFVPPLFWVVVSREAPRENRVKNDLVPEIARRGGMSYTQRLNLRVMTPLYCSIFPSFPIISIAKKSEHLPLFFSKKRRFQRLPYAWERHILAKKFKIKFAKIQ